MARRSPIRTGGWRTAIRRHPGVDRRAERADRVATSPRCPARPVIRARLDELLAIGALSTPTPARGRYFYQRRDGRQNQPVLYVREGVDGEDRVADRSQRARCRRAPPRSTGTIPARTARLLAYGLSENGSEQSVLHVLEVDSRRAAARSDPADARGGSGVAARRQRVLLHPLSRAGRGARGRGALPPRGVTSTGWAPIPRTTRWSSSRRRRNTGPASACRPTAAGCVIGVARTFDQTDLYLQDLAGGERPAGAGRRGSAGDLRRRGRRTAGCTCAPTSTRRPTGSIWSIPERPAREALAGDRAAASRMRCSTAFAVTGSTAGAELPGASRVAAAPRRPRRRHGAREVALPTLG